MKKKIQINQICCAYDMNPETGILTQCFERAVVIESGIPVCENHTVKNITRRAVMRVDAETLIMNRKCTQHKAQAVYRFT